MTSGIKVTAPATISNINCGFDILGMALNVDCDEIIGKQVDKPGVHLQLIGRNAKNTPTDPAKNTAGVAVNKLLEFLGEKEFGVELKIKKHINPGSGLGSSAASACAAVFLVNELLGRPKEKRELLPFAILGEHAADQAFHADNVAPCLLGGTIMIRDLMLLDTHRLYAPRGLQVTVATPQVQIFTEEARGVLSPTVTMDQMIRQSANVAAFVHAMHNSDFDLLGRALQDHIVEAQRAHLIPGFYDIKEKVLQSGALGFGISGSGPTLFVISTNENVARDSAQIIEGYYKDRKIECITYISEINHEGTMLC